MSVARGYTLIEMMVSVAILAVGTNLLVGAFQAYETAGHRARAVAAIAEALNQEMEAARACRNRACLNDFATQGPIAPAKQASQSWLRPRIERQLRPGPDGTMAVAITAGVPDLVPPRTLVALMVVAP